jgi:serine/threonine-protein kinase
MLYEMLSGKVPFTGDTSLAVMAQHIQGTIPRLDKVQAGISPQLAAIVARALQRAPDDRYPTLKEFINDLDHQDAVDTSILNKATAPPAIESSPWRSPAVIGITILAILGIILLIVALRGATP